MVAVALIIGLGIFEFILRVNHNSNHERIYTSLSLNGEKYTFQEIESAFYDPKSAILFIGDSFTTGKVCGNKGSFPGALQKILIEKSAPLHTVNLGRVGYQTFSYLTVLENYLKTFGPPKGVVITLYANDVELEPSLCSFVDALKKSGHFNASEMAEIETFCSEVKDTEGGEFQGPGTHPLVKLHRALAYELLTYQLLREGAMRALIAINYDMGIGRTAFRRYWEKHDELRFKLITFALKQAAERLKQQGVPLVILIYPDIISITSENPYVEIYRRAAEKLSADLAVPALSGYDAFLSSKETRQNMAWSWVDTHPNCKAHEIFGGWVFDTLKKQTRLFASL
jgi:lysophospholipase L1-like esterase